MLYTVLDRGTPIILHKGNSALTVAFADENESYETPALSELRQTIFERFNVLYNAEYFLTSRSNILLDETNISAAGLPIGNTDLIPARQALPSKYLWIASSTPEEEKINSLLNGNNLSQLALNSLMDSKLSYSTF
jgi:hypothetical protein